MTANNERLRDLMALATKDLRQGRSELLEALKHIPVRELHNADPTLFTRLTPDQRAELFSRMAQHPRHSGPAYSISGRRPRPRSPSVIRRFWNRLPLTGRSQLVGLFAVSLLACLSVMIFSSEDPRAGAVVPAAISGKVETWPVCRRLAPTRDACIYVVSDGLSWDQAAQQLDQNLAELMNANRHLADRSRLYQGDRLIIWRNRIRLEN